MMKYSEEDLEFDCELFLSETEDININWLLVSEVDKIVSTYSREEEAVYSAINNHNKIMRYLTFAKSALDVEIDNATKIAIEGNKSETDIFPTLSTARDFSLTDLPIKLRVKEIRDIDNMLARHETKEARHRQLKKDVERDVLLINGIRLSGAAKGLEHALQLTGDICDLILKECDLKPLVAGLREAFCETLLSVASRTHSGGITFQALQSAIDPSIFMLIPQSAAARPINVQVSVGAFPQSYYTSNLSQNINRAGGKKRWGLLCHVTCESLFEVQNRDNPMERGRNSSSSAVGADGEAQVGPDSVPLVRVVYEDHVLLDLKSADIARNVDGYADAIVSNSKELGSVALSLIATPE